MTDVELDALPMYAVVYRTNEYFTPSGRLAPGSLGTLVPTPRNREEIQRPARCVQWHSTGEVTVPPAKVIHTFDATYLTSDEDTLQSTVTNQGESHEV